jgi:hypothetical protein
VAYFVKSIDFETALLDSEKKFDLFCLKIPPHLADLVEFSALFTETATNLCSIAKQCYFGE